MPAEHHEIDIADDHDVDSPRRPARVYRTPTGHDSHAVGCGDPAGGRERRLMATPLPKGCGGCCQRRGIGTRCRMEVRRQIHAEVNDQDRRHQGNTDDRRHDDARRTGFPHSSTRITARARSGIRKPPKIDPAIL